MNESEILKKGAKKERKKQRKKAGTMTNIGNKPVDNGLKD